MAAVVTPGASRLRFSHSSAMARATPSQSPRAERVAHRRGGVPDPLEAVEHVAVAVDVLLGDLPVVGAGVARLARVAEDDPLLQLAGSTSSGTRWMPSTSSSRAAMPPYSAGR